ncbi:MAG: hypothetical protein AAF411_24300, partial [Myxococcota bacterium]
TQAYGEWRAAFREAGDADLEFQLAALREQLERLERDAADARQGMARRLERVSAERRSVESRLVALSQELAVAFRPHPEAQPIFRKLRGA